MTWAGRVDVDRVYRRADGGDAIIFSARGASCPNQLCGHLEVNGARGVASVGLMPGQAYEIEVASSARRQGVATALYETAARELCARWGLPLMSDVARSASADAFWRKQVTKGRAVKVVVPQKFADERSGVPYAYQLRCPAPESLAGRGRMDSMAGCRKQTVKEALAEAQRGRRKKLTPLERRVVTASVRQNPVLICSPARRKRRRR